MKTMIAVLVLGACTFFARDARFCHHKFGK